MRSPLRPEAVRSFLDGLRRTGKVFPVLLLLDLFSCPPADAYVDPNAGGFLFQLLFPLFMAFAAMWVFLRKKAIEVGKRILKFLCETIVARHKEKK